MFIATFPGYAVRTESELQIAERAEPYRREFRRESILFNMSDKTLFWSYCRKTVCTVHSYLVDPASGHMLISKIKPCMSKHELNQSEAANSSLQ